MSDHFIQLSDQNRLCSDIVSEHCLNLISGSDLCFYSYGLVNSRELEFEWQVAQKNSLEKLVLPSWWSLCCYKHDITKRDADKTPQ